MTAETVYEVVQALDNKQRELLRQMLNTDTDKEPQKPRSKKKKLWDENKLRERIINDFKKEQESSKTKTPSPTPL